MLLTVIAFGLGLIAFVFVLSAITAFGRGKMLAGSFRFLSGVVLLLVALLAGAVIVGTTGYRALTHETLAATVETERVGRDGFEARFEFPDGEVRRFRIRGDQLYVDAHILKWRPFANVLGLHTVYELDRVAGRYEDLVAERTEPRTVFSLARSKPLDFFHVARRYPLLDRVVDARYGSASFIPAREGGRFELRVSTTGLLFRPVFADSRP